jgi:hypothetical protein
MGAISQYDSYLGNKAISNFKTRSFQRKKFLVMDDLYAVFAGAKICHSQSEALRNAFDLKNRKQKMSARAVRIDLSFRLAAITLRRNLRTRKA